MKPLTAPIPGRRRLIVTYEGLQWPLADLARVSGVAYDTLRARLQGRSRQPLVRPAKQLRTPPAIEVRSRGLL